MSAAWELRRALLGARGRRVRVRLAGGRVVEGIVRRVDRRDAVLVSAGRVAALPVDDVIEVERLGLREDVAPGRNRGRDETRNETRNRGRDETRATTWRFDRVRGELVEVPVEEPSERLPWRTRRHLDAGDLAGAAVDHVLDAGAPVRRGDVGHLRRALDGFDPFRPGGGGR